MTLLAGLQDVVVEHKLQAQHKQYKKQLLLEIVNVEQPLQTNKLVQE
jgi:hypothetical protein